MLEHVIVWTIVGIAIFYIVRTIYSSIKNKKKCGTCSLCGPKNN
ncbi:FeoB-associated Cys-rich membrane protein [bacterium]|nr:FeoB-associated Cys-rich membrane protein [bacterium]